MDYYQSYDLKKGYNIFDVAGNVCYLKRSDTIKERFCGEGNGMYGKHHSDETKRKIAESKIGKTHAPTHFKRVRCVETGKIYNSQSEAAQEYGITQAAISAVCKGKNKTAKKMHWEFVD